MDDKIQYGTKVDIKNDNVLDVDGSLEFHD
jgi:hypothetical protein